MSGIESLLAEIREVVNQECAERLPLFDTFANEARFARTWLAPSLQVLSPGASILEVGAGTLLLSCQLASEGFHVTAVEPIGEGFDEFRELQQLVQQVAGRTTGRLRVLSTPVEEMSLEGPFDFAFSVNVMEHVPSVSGALTAIFAVLRPSASYRFTCPNYLFPYEPHFNIPTLFSKALTARLMGRRIRAYAAAADPEGLWQSLNWITVPAVARACRKLAGARAVFDTNILADALERVVFDPVFAARRPAWLRAIARGLVATRLHRLLALLPAFMQPIIDCRIERVGSLAEAAQGTRR